MSGPRPGPGSDPRGRLDLSCCPMAARWLDASGPHADIVISTRMRLAQNDGTHHGAGADGERLRMLARCGTR